MPPAVPSGAAHAASPVSLPEPPCQRPPAPSVDERQTCARHPELCPRRTRTPVESPRTTPRSLFSFAPAPSVHRPDAWRVADFFIAGGPFEIMEVSHSRVSKTAMTVDHIRSQFKRKGKEQLVPLTVPDRWPRLPGIAYEPRSTIRPLVISCGLGQHGAP